MTARPKASISEALLSLGRDSRGTSAVEFAIVSMPVILMMLMILQMGIYYMTQSSLDAGTIQAADSLVNSFYTSTTPSVPTAAQLKTLVLSKSGGLVRNNASLFVELRLFATLSATSLPISNTVDPSVAGSILALRAQASVPIFVPGLGSILVVRSSALLRRQNY